MDFQTLLELHLKDPEKRFKGVLLALDPGETTGWTIFKDGKFKVCGQIKTWPIADGVTNLAMLLDTHSPDHVVFERYGIYKWKTETHSNSDVPTLQVIGMIKTLCILESDIPYSMQTAQIAKGFCTDQKLKDWGFWESGQRHARDAIRHACYYLLFRPKNDS